MNFGNTPKTQKNIIKDEKETITILINKLKRNIIDYKTKYVLLSYPQLKIEELHKAMEKYVDVVDLVEDKDKKKVWKKQKKYYAAQYSQITNQLWIHYTV